jgi:hypothetical protein
MVPSLRRSSHDHGAGGGQGGAGRPVVVAAQQQVNRMQPARGRGHDDRDRRPGRTAARPVGNRQRPSQPRQFIVQPGRAVTATMPEPASHVTSITPRRYWPAGAASPRHTPQPGNTSGIPRRTSHPAHERAGPRPFRCLKMRSSRAPGSSRRRPGSASLPPGIISAVPASRPYPPRTSCCLRQKAARRTRPGR